MAILTSSFDPRSESSQKNYDYNLALIEKYHSVVKELKNGGEERYREKHIGKGKLLARERIERLADPGAPFLELGLFGGYQVYEEYTPCAGVIAGVTQIHGRLCLVAANDATVKGGAYFPLTVKKHLRAQVVAEQNNLPCVYLVDSAGAYLPMQDEVFPDQHNFGRIFYNQARLSAAGIAQISAVMGSCTAGGAYVPAMSDQSIIVKGTGSIYLAGPPLVKAATGEVVSAEDLGGADVHSKESGVVDYVAEDDDHALHIVRDCIRNLGNVTPATIELREPVEPEYDPEDLLSIWPADRKQQVDIREVIARIVDASDFQEFKSDYGKTLVTGFAHIYGVPCGIVANNGILFTESAEKGAHFISLCSQQKIPLVFLHNITGFMVGSDAEKKGIAKAGAKMVNAVSTCGVPRLSVILGGSIGAGNYGMCGRAYDPNFLWAWPTSYVSIMGAEQAADVLTSIKKAQYERSGKKLSDKEVSDIASPIMEEFTVKSDPFYASARLWDDGIIDPRSTREVLGQSLLISINKPFSPSGFGVFRM